MDEEVKIKVEEVADRVFEDIRYFFQEKLPAEQTIRAEVEPVERTQEEDVQEVRCSLKMTFFTPTNHTLEGALVITHSGGNVYGIAANIAEGDSKTFDISLPDSPSSHGGTGAYTHDLCTFILVELERITGERFLRDATQQSDS